jgi:hypothetical protein
MVLLKIMSVVAPQLGVLPSSKSSPKAHLGVLPLEKSSPKVHLGILPFLKSYPTTMNSPLVKAVDCQILKKVKTTVLDG